MQKVEICHLSQTVFRREEGGAAPLRLVRSTQNPHLVHLTLGKRCSLLGFSAMNRAKILVICNVLLFLHSLLVKALNRPGFHFLIVTYLSWICLPADLAYQLDFYNWNKVFVRYCDGASFSRDAEYEDQVGLFYFCSLIWYPSRDLQINRLLCSAVVCYLYSQALSITHSYIYSFSAAFIYYSFLLWIPSSLQVFSAAFSSSTKH